MSKKKKIEIKPIRDAREYVLYRRVSTQEQGDSRLGLLAQETFAKMVMGKEPAQVFTEVHSGTKLKQCKELWAAIELCGKNNYLLVVARYDRFRNVQEALEILDTVGEGNLYICDLPTTDRFVLTIMFAVAEKQAMAIRVNTKVALAERKRQIAENGGFFSKAGIYRTHLGNAKGMDMSKAVAVSAVNSQKEADEWRRTSPLFTWVEIQLLRHRPRKEIVAEGQKLFEQNPTVYCSREGRPLTMALLSKYSKYIGLPKA